MTSLKDFSLEGKNAWITGASYGIGFNIASAFAAAGIKTIVFNDIKQELVDRGLAAYKAAGIENVKGYVCDVTNEEQVAELVKTIHEEVGQIDILVNNAGIIKRIPMHEMKRAEFQQVIDIDLVGPFICSSAVIPEMMERREGVMVLALATSLLLRQLLFVSVRLTVVVTHSIASFALRLQLVAGSILLSLVVLQYSWLLRLLMLSMVIYCMLMVVSSHTSVSSQSNKRLNIAQ